MAKQRLWVQIRLFPIWLRIVIVLLLLAGAAVLGVIIGYGYIGDGQPADALKKETWIHILDIIKGKES
ncbi:DNA-directed RNA polymerase subunit beta [Sporosarcina luteola]|nr:DNA-directed RNA polymerase subunit beta [Sporosarcina luteola]